MKDGCVVEFGSADNILNKPKDAYTKKLIKSSMLDKS
jgi:ABC-type microcin C transport system duplicated ATPase subunit YejF